MAKLPDGWVFIPKVVAKGTKIEVTEHELVLCKNCIHAKQYTLFGGTIALCERLETHFPIEEEGYCSFGVKEDEE